MHYLMDQTRHRKQTKFFSYFRRAFISVGDKVLPNNVVSRADWVGAFHIVNVYPSLGLAHGPLSERVKKKADNETHGQTLVG